jgi:hypothetical protein
MICVFGKGGGNKAYVRSVDEETSWIMATCETEKAIGNWHKNKSYVNDCNSGRQMNFTRIVFSGWL